MVHYIYQGLLGVVVLVVLSACSVSTLELNDSHEVVLTYNEKSIEAEGESLDENTLIYSTIIVKQNILQFKDKSLLVFESTDVDKLYMYKYATQNSIEMIFDAKKIKTIYRRNNLYFFQITLKNEKVLNALVQQSGDQSLSMIYGFSTVQFKKILGQVEGSDTFVAKLNTEKIEVLNDPKNTIRSKWNMKLINVDSLIVMNDTLLGR